MTVRDVLDDLWAAIDTANDAVNALPFCPNLEHQSGREIEQTATELEQAMISLRKVNGAMSDTYEVYAYNSRTLLDPDNHESDTP